MIETVVLLLVAGLALLIVRRFRRPPFRSTPEPKGNVIEASGTAHSRSSSSGG